MEKKKGYHGRGSPKDATCWLPDEACHLFWEHKKVDRVQFAMESNLPESLHNIRDNSQKSGVEFILNQMHCKIFSKKNSIFSCTWYLDGGQGHLILTSFSRKLLSLLVGRKWKCWTNWNNWSELFWGFVLVPETFLATRIFKCSLSLFLLFHPCVSCFFWPFPESLSFGFALFRLFCGGKTVLCGNECDAGGKRLNYHGSGFKGEPGGSVLHSARCSIGWQVLVASALNVHWLAYETC